MKSKESLVSFQECARRQHLRAKIDDLPHLSQGQTALLSDAEKLMHRQLERAQIQTNLLKEKLSLLQQFIGTKQFFMSNDQEQLSVETIQPFLQYFQNQIDQLKEKVQTIDQTN